MLNLAANAFQHTTAANTIEIGAAPLRRSSIKLWVRDDGPGVDPAIADKLFDRRFPGAASRTLRTDGMGIGLSIVDAVAGPTAAGAGGERAERGRPLRHPLADDHRPRPTTRTRQ